jgi:branched-chain amino acid transport system substrate-binding protein
MFRRAFFFLAGSLALAACGGTSPPSQPYPYIPPPGSLLGSGGPPGMAQPFAPATPAPFGHGVALLVGLSGPNAGLGQALVNAAQLALAAPGSPALDVRDTGGTQGGAAAAAQAAIANGAGLLIGPLTAQETAGVASVARSTGVAVLAFTNDPAQSQPGVWTLGITPVQQVRRLVGAAMTQNKPRFAAALPSTAFGQAMGAALTQALSAAGAPSPDVRYYEATNAAVSGTLRDLSQYAARRGPLEARRRAALAQHTAAGRKEAVELSRAQIPPPPFDALLLAETGDRLAWLSSFLSYYDIESPTVQVMGPALWASSAARAGADLHGAWYAAPDPATRASFEAAYTARYGAPPAGIADFAYDAAAIARVLASEGNFSFASICRPDGFAGVDGLLVLHADGTVRRGLALFAIGAGGPSIIEPAPAAITAPGI